jgi:arylsulfatase A-like enzyme
MWQLAICLAAALLSGASAQNLVAGEKPANQPNILMIFADDLGWADVDWHDEALSTPNINKLCHENAVELNNSYNNMLCSMTRSSLYTGYDAYHLGTHTLVINHQEGTGIPLEYPFFGEMLKSYGYRSYMVGKWHMGFCRKEYLPTNRGFDKFTGLYLGDGDHYYNHWAKYTDPFGGTRTGYYMTKEENGIGEIDYSANGTYSTEFFSRRMFEYIQQHQDETPDKPWMGLVSYQGVHCPLQAPSQEHLDRCKDIEGQFRRVYCSMVCSVDDWVGWMVEQLQAMNLYDNTIIIYTSDNGGELNSGGRNYPLRGGKGDMWEGGVRTVNCWHYEPWGDYRVSDLLFHVTDYYPTFAGIAGSTATKYGDGFNLWPQINKQDDSNPRNMMIYNLGPTGSAMRWNNYKLILGLAKLPLGKKRRKRQADEEVADIDAYFDCADKDPDAEERQPEPFPDDVTEFLFDLSEDPLELNNLAPSQPALVNRLKRLLNQYMAQQAPPITFADRPDLRKNPKAMPLLKNDTWFSGWCETN